MLDLNRIFANQSLAANSFALTTSLMAGQSVNPVGTSSSFTDVLNSVQEAAISEQEPQTETWPSAVTTQQFQTVSSMQTGSPGSSTSNEDNSSQQPYCSTEPKNAQSAVPSKPATPSAVKREDVYQKHSSSDNAASESDGLSSEASSDASGNSSTSKLKHHTESSGQSDAGATVLAGSIAGPEAKNGLSAASPASSSSAVGSPIVPDADRSASTLNAVDSKAGATDKSLAFAVRVNGSAAASAPNDAGLSSAPADAASLPNSLGASQSSSFAAQLSAMMGPSASVPALAAPAGDLAQTGTPAVGLANGGLSPAGSSPVSEAPADEPAEEVAPVVETSEPGATAQPVKAVQVQITGADNQKVDLKLVEKAGTLTMSVRSADGTLTKALQQSLPELSNRLHEQQIQAEWWKPDAVKADTQQRAPASPGGGGNSSSRQDQGGKNGGDPGQQGGRGAPQPNWVEELTELRKSNQTGAQYSWRL